MAAHGIAGTSSISNFNFKASVYPVVYSSFSFSFFSFYFSLFFFLTSN